jgi:hypothetical protein
MIAVIPERLRPVRTTRLVRLGDVRDGGYVVSQDAIVATDTLVSMGVSTNWEFEKAFRTQRQAAGLSLQIHAYDHTIDARLLRTYMMKQLARYALSFDRDYLTRWRMASGFTEFFDGRTATHFKQRVWRNDDNGDASVETVMSRTAPDRRVFVKMDIEGGEYRVVADLARYADRIVGFVIEFHDLDILRSAFESHHARLEDFYDVVHIHANNVGGLGPEGLPNILEVTYERKGLAQREANLAARYPLPGVDKPNCMDLPDFELEFV